MYRILLNFVVVLLNLKVIGTICIIIICLDNGTEWLSVQMEIVNTLGDSHIY